MIKAEGIKDRHKMTVIYEDGKYTFNGKENEIYKAQMDVLLSSELPIFGTYISTDPSEELNIVGKLATYFFDKYTYVTSDHDIQGEWEKGEVY